MTITQVGLLLDVIGALILFIFGMPSGYIEDVDSMGGLSIGSRKESEKKIIQISNKTIKPMSAVGLSLVIIGFFLQFVGTF